MRQLDQDDSKPLGSPIRPAPAPVPPRQFNSDGTIYTDASGKLGTNIPPPPTIWDIYLQHQKATP